MSLSTVKTWMKNEPRLRPVMPILREIMRAYRKIVKPILSLFWTVPRDLVHLLFLPYRLGHFLWNVHWLRQQGRTRIHVPEHKAGTRRIVMLVNTDLRMDPRVQREAKALAGQGFLVTIICPNWAQLDPKRDLAWDPNIDFRLLPARCVRFNLYFPYLYGKIMLRAAQAEDAWAYHAHDLDMSLIALLAAAHNQVACVCDFHEWYSENVTYNRLTRRFRPHRFYKRWVYQTMERVVLHAATEVITVCDSIGERLARIYDAPKQVHIIRNIPEINVTDRQPGTDLRKKLGISPDKKIVLYQGGLGPSRNLEPVIEAMAQVKHAVFVIRGPGYEYWHKRYHRLAARFGARDKVYCLPAVPSTRVVAEARAADIGLWTLLANVGLNFELALPNKVFEYIAAGVPLLAADLPEVRKIVQGYRIGVCFDPVSPASIARAINALAESDAFYDECRRNIAGAVRDLRADEEWNKLVNLYRNLAA